MNLPINILFLGGSKRVSVAEIFINSGRHLKKEVKIFSYELNEYEPIASIGTIVRGLKWTDPNILTDLEEVINGKQIDIVIPFVDIATILCGKLQKKMTGIFFAISNEEISTIMFDKRVAHSWFVSQQFQVPSSELRLPLIAKLNTGSGGKGIKFFYHKAYLDLFFLENDQNDYFLQEIIEGDEYSVDCYVDKWKNIISIVPRLRLEIINGEATKSMTVKDVEIINQSRNILLSGEFSGPVTIQFIRQKGTHSLFLIEINPRLGSGVLTSIKAGADICKFILHDYLNIDNEEVIDWVEKILMVRTFKEFYFNATNN